MNNCNPNKTKISHKQAKASLRIIENENTNSKELMIAMKILNKYKLNIYHILNFMCRIKINIAIATLYNISMR